MSQRITIEATYLFDEKSPCFIPRHVLFMLKTPVRIDPHGKSGYGAVHFSFGFLKQRMTMELRFPFFHGRRTLLSNAVLHGAWGWAAGTASGGKRPRADQGTSRRATENITTRDPSHLHQVMKKARLVNLLFGNQNTFISSYNCYPLFAAQHWRVLYLLRSH